LVSLLSLLDCCREILVNNTKIDVLNDRDNRNFGKMTNVIGCDQHWLVLSRRVWVYMGGGGVDGEDSGLDGSGIFQSSIGIWNCQHQTCQENRQDKKQMGL
jgi:hypothetical protein